MPQILERVRKEKAAVYSPSTKAPVKEEKKILTHLFHSLDPNSRGKIKIENFLKRLEENGLSINCSQLAPLKIKIEDLGNQKEINIEEFETLILPCFSMVSKLLQGDLIIPNFKEFKQNINMIFERSKCNTGGKVADYIPQLKRVPADLFALSVCTIDGQSFDLGDSEQKFCVQSTCKPLNYCLALEEHGVDYVHQFIGREPSGRGFNELSLNKDGLPHNPMINAGAIMSSALIKPELNKADRFDFLMQNWKIACGEDQPGFNNSVYLSEKETADRNFALGYFMRENNAFPPNTNLIEVLEFYFQCCSVQLTVSSMARFAGTLANAGVVPTTGTSVFKQDTVKNCLSLMSSCGMYDFSGEFAFSVGLPAKSGVSGALILVVPNVLGMCIWSPRLDELGNSVRGIEFCKHLIDLYNFHNFDSLITQGSKLDPRHNSHIKQSEYTVALCWAASVNNVGEIKQLVAKGVNLSLGDYDGRTPLHIAASEGHLETILYLLDHNVNINVKDRWGRTPLDDAMSNHHEKIANILKENNKNPLVREM